MSERHDDHEPDRSPEPRPPRSEDATRDTPRKDRLPRPDERLASPFRFPRV